MSDSPQCLLIVTAYIDPAVEADWNTWYDEVHLPDALACPGVLRGARYMAARDASLTDHGEKKPATGRKCIPRSTSSQGRRPWIPLNSRPCAGGISSQRISKRGPR